MFYSFHQSADDMNWNHLNRKIRKRLICRTKFLHSTSRFSFRFDSWSNVAREVRQENSSFFERTAEHIIAESRAKRQRILFTFCIFFFISLEWVEYALHSFLWSVSRRIVDVVWAGVSEWVFVCVRECHTIFIFFCFPFECNYTHMKRWRNKRKRMQGFSMASLEFFLFHCILSLRYCMMSRCLRCSTQ